MALRKCSECGEKVSNKAEICPDCGKPTKFEKKQRDVGLLIILATALGMFVVFWGFVIL